MPRGWVLGALGALACASVACAAGDDDAASASADLSAAPSPCPSASAEDLAALAAIDDVSRACFDAPPPDAGPLRPFATYRSATISVLGALHQGRDQLYVPGEPQWIIGRFLYGGALALLGEEVDIDVLRGCTGTWERLGTTRTTAVAGEHPPVDGVDDPGGRVYFPIPTAKRLGVGRHRVRMVVAGDHSVAEAFLEVLPRGTPLLVSDVDGTLTERLENDSSLVCDEESVFPAIGRALDGSIPQARLHAGAAPLYQGLVAQGYRPLYLTARPEFLAENTRRFLREDLRGDGRGDLPAGAVHTTLTLTGAFDVAAQQFKTDELLRLLGKGLKLYVGFGNRTSDVAAYDALRIPHKFFYENPSTPWRTCSDVDRVDPLPRPFRALTGGDYRFADFAALGPGFASVPRVCPAAAADAGPP